MKKNFFTYLLPALLLGFMSVSFVACGGDDEDNEPNKETTDGSGNQGGQDNVEVKDIVVTVDADGKADGGHTFQRIDETSFIIDNLKYTVSQGELIVSGYDKVFFKGSANIISALKYNGQTFIVTSIGESAFRNCTGLTSISIPNSVTSIGGYAFLRCNGLTSVTIPSSVISIGEAAFVSCSGLISVTIPENVTNISAGVFCDCTGLTSITIPNGVSSIGNDAFEGCSGLTSITLPNGVTSIGYAAFYGCSSLTSITIPDGVTSIGETAFYGCSGLTSITIPDSVASIGEKAFYGCTGLTSIKVESGNKAYDSRDHCNAIIKTATNALCVGCSETKIPNGVISIGDYAFYGYTSLTSITIPNSVISIGICAFLDCSSLKEVYCYAKILPSASSYTFEFVPLSQATLHVPAVSIDVYKRTQPWSSFGTIVAIEE